MNDKELARFVLTLTLMVLLSLFATCSEIQTIKDRLNALESKQQVLRW